MIICTNCGHKGVPETASFCPMCGAVVNTAPKVAAKPKPAAAAKADPHEARTEVINQDEIKARMGEIRERMNKMRGTNNAISASTPAIKPETTSSGPQKAVPQKPVPQKKTGKSSRRRKGFSETLWFMQAQVPETMLVDSNTDIGQEDLQDKYTKKETIEMNVRKEFSLNIDLDDFDD